MPACPNGAEPKPGFQGIVRWLEDADFPAEVLAIINVLKELLDPYSSMQLFDIDEICASNLDPPEPITLQEIAAWTRFGGGVGLQPDAAFIQKVISYARYNVFLQNCQCIVPPATPGNNCTAAPSSFPLGSLGSIAGPFPVTIDQAVLDSWFVFPDGDWVWGFQGSCSVSGAATDGNNLDTEFQAVDGSWVAGPDLFTLMANSAQCTYPIYQSTVPRIGSSTAVRIRNNAGGTYTINNFSFCFCPSVTSPTPLPPQPPIPTLPAPPPVVCGDDTLCVLIMDLARRLTTLAAQVSDIQASLTGADVLVELSRLSMTPEGEVPLVLGTRAVSVELTALGDDAFTSALGRPRGLMRVGSVRWGDGVGYSPRRFIDADRFDDTRPEGATSISWQLLPGTQGILKFLG